MVTLVGHNRRMTLFDVDALGSDDTAAPPSSEPNASDEWGEWGDGSDPADTPTDAAPISTAVLGRTGEARPDVEVRVSRRRKKTSEARWVAGRIVVSVPAHLDLMTRDKTVNWLVERLMTRQRMHIGDDELLVRAVALSQRYLNGARPRSVRWVTNQSARWGSCSCDTGDIRLSHRLRVVPGWVLDSVLVHELAHLTHPDHSSAFHDLADGYPRHREAGLFLAGYGLGLTLRMDRAAVPFVATPPWIATRCWLPPGGWTHRIAPLPPCGTSFVRPRDPLRVLLAP
jgi:hypothetical protein